MLFGSVLRLCAQTCGATYITEFQYDLKKRTNWCNLLRLDAYVPIGTKGILEFASIHVYKTRPERIMSGVVRGMAESSVPVGSWLWRGNPAGMNCCGDRLHSLECASEC